MFSRNPRPRRQPLTRRQLASPSMLSVFSTHTQNSKSSSGSNSTVTQESVLWGGKHRSSKSGVVKKSSSDKQKRSNKRTNHPTSHPKNYATFEEEEEEEAAASPVEKGGKPNVWAYEVHDERDERDGDEEEEEEEELKAEDDDSDSDISSIPDFDGPGNSTPAGQVNNGNYSKASNPFTRLPAAPQPPVTSASTLPPLSESFEDPLAGRPLSFASVHSDSGISIRSSSSERGHTAQQKQQLPPSKPITSLFRSSRPMIRGGSNSSIASSSASASSRAGPPAHSHQWDGTPESFYARGAANARTKAGTLPTTQTSKALATRTSESSKKTSKSKFIKALTTTSTSRTSTKSSKTAKPPTTPLLPSNRPSTKRGYALLASSLTTTTPPPPSSPSSPTLAFPRPLYRRFESLQNRILLTLQDELYAIETDLAHFDAQIAATHPANRAGESIRAEFHHPTPLQAQRNGLVGLLVNKMAVYNRALLGYQGVARMRRVVEGKDEKGGRDGRSDGGMEREREIEMGEEEQGWVRGYREFVERFGGEEGERGDVDVDGMRRMIVEGEMRWLEEVGDLVVVEGWENGIGGRGKGGRRGRWESSERVGVEYKVVAAGVMVLVVVFRMMPSLLARLAVGGCVLAGMGWMGVLPMGIRGEEETEGDGRAWWGREGGLYVAAILVLAFAVG